MFLDPSNVDFRTYIVDNRLSFIRLLEFAKQKISCSIVITHIFIDEELNHCALQIVGVLYIPGY